MPIIFTKLYLLIVLKKSLQVCKAVGKNETTQYLYLLCGYVQLSYLSSLYLKFSFTLPEKHAGDQQPSKFQLKLQTYTDSGGPEHFNLNSQLTQED